MSEAEPFLALTAMGWEGPAPAGGAGAAQGSVHGYNRAQLQPRHLALAATQ